MRGIKRGLLLALALLPARAFAADTVTPRDSSNAPAPYQVPFCPIGATGLYGACSTTNPLPVAVVSGGGGGGSGSTGTVGAAGANGTQAQSIQGITGGVPVPISGSFLLDTTFTGRINTLGQKTAAQSTPVVLPSDQTVPVSGTFFQATQPVSGTFWQATQPVSGTFWQATQPISAASLPLPAGAATSAGQSAASTALSSIDTKTPALVGGRQPVDGSGVVQPVSFTDNVSATGSPWTISATGAQPGFLATGYSSISVELLSGNISGSVESSNDSTDGVNGTWRQVFGQSYTDATNVPTPTISGTFPRRTFAANSARWFRLNVATYTSGPATVVAILRSSPAGERAVYVANSPSLGTSASTIGGTFGAATATSGGVITASRIPSSAASTNLTQVKSGGGRIYKIVACNTTTTPVRIKLYNSLLGSTVVGSSTPLFTRPIPPATAAGGLNCASYDQADIGWYFGVAITYALVTGAADNDNTAVAAGAITDLSVEYQ